MQRRFARACGPRRRPGFQYELPATLLRRDLDDSLLPEHVPAALRTARRWRRALLWAALVGLLVVAQTLLIALTARHERNRLQEQTDGSAVASAGDVKQVFARDLQGLQALLWREPTPQQWARDAAVLLRDHPEMLRVEVRTPQQGILQALDTPYRRGPFSTIAREDIDLETEVACNAATRLNGAVWSHSYFVPQGDGVGAEVVDVCLPMSLQGQRTGYMAASVDLRAVLDTGVATDILRQYELSFVEGDGTRLARAGVPRGAGVYVSERLVDLQGVTLALKVDNSRGEPGLIPNVATALVIGLSFMLAGLVFLLVRDVRRRAQAESRLAQELTLRRAMENSLVTGLRARDLQGRITYVNPAFCDMVGFAPADLLGQDVPPYWPPEFRNEYRARQARRHAGNAPPREGFESIFVNAGGERFPVMVYEAPLIGVDGQQTGWMSAVLDLSAQRRVEELSRQQQERLQATARLATVGEMASLLGHELNQPLAAIASFATGSLNLIGADGHAPDAQMLPMLREAIARIAEQAERAGRVIKSVHDFVRRREQHREAISVDQLVEAVMPLVRLQARKSSTRVDLDLPKPSPRVACDRTMVEQVLLNLTRNAMQAMEGLDAAERLLTLRVRVHGDASLERVSFSVIDRGPGISDTVAAQLFTPFFTTRSEGMGLGLSLCRTVAEQHGGALEYENVRDLDGRTLGAEFRFSLPTPRSSARVAPDGLRAASQQTSGLPS